MALFSFYRFQIDAHLIYILRKPGGSWLSAERLLPPSQEGQPPIDPALPVPPPSPSSFPSPRWPQEPSVAGRPCAKGVTEWHVGVSASGQSCAHRGAGGEQRHAEQGVKKNQRGIFMDMYLVVYVYIYESERGVRG